MRRHQDMRVLFALLALTLWFVSCSAIDSFTSNATSYNVGDQMVLTLVTANVYSHIDITVNNPSIVFASITDASNGFTGTLTFTGTVTCRMAATASSNQLNIVATVVPFPSGSPSTLTLIPPTVLTPPGACNVYFTVPATDPAQIGAGQSFSVTIQTTSALNEAYITLNGQFFCNIGPVGASATGSCTGFVPCFLPSCAEFAIVGQVTGSPAVTYPGPTVQLIPNPDCAPIFGVQSEQTPVCSAPFIPLSVFDFTLQISPEDNINEYSNFEIWASSTQFGIPPSIFIARVAGPLCTLVNGQFTYLIARWTIPCELNTAGLLNFTLTYTQTLDSNEKILKFLPLIPAITIGSNILCNLSLILNFPGRCPAPYIQSDCGCLAEGSGSSLAPCANCPACPSLAFTGFPDGGTFLPGDTINFYIHNGSNPSFNETRGIQSNNVYYFHAVQYNYAVSATKFYAGILNGISSLSFKPIGVVGPVVTPITITSPGTSLVHISAYTISPTVDNIWATSINNDLFCGLVGGVIVPSTVPSLLPSITHVVDVSVGPSGVWIINNFAILYFKTSTTCNVGASWVNSGINFVDFVSAGATVVYYHSIAGLFYLTPPSLIPTPVPSGGPSTVSNLTASTIDDSLLVVDAFQNVWQLSGPTGTWTNLGIQYLIAVPYDFNNLYVFYQSNIDDLWYVNHIKMGLIPIYNIIPGYTGLSLVIESILPNLLLYAPPPDPSFDSCNNALVASWTIPASYKSAGNTTASLSYTALYPSGAVQSLNSSVSFNIGPVPLDASKARSFCPLPCITQPITPAQRNLGCSSCQ